MIARLAVTLLAWAGRRRIRAGYCPACYSSPPLPDCPVCDGTTDYGPALRWRTEQLWRDRWTAYVALIR